MRITRDDVLHIARLAEIAVEEAELAPLVKQLDRIVGYVAQLDQAPEQSTPPPFVPGPAQVAWRADTVQPVPLAIPPAELAPAWREGFFIVPRLAGMEPE